MKHVLAFLFLLVASSLAAQTVTGKWLTVDDKTNTNRSIVEIYERNGKVYGKILKVFLRNGETDNDVCDECSKNDPRYMKPIKGMEFLIDMEKDGDEYAGGTILDPENGMVYTCKIWMDGEKLKVRGYLGLFYRTQTWTRAK